MAATTLAGAFAQGVDASKPAASSSLEGYVYFSTDINGGTIYQCKSSAWVQLTTGVSAVKANGLTGATAASRYAGATTSSSPASGTFAVGDFVIAQNGAVWVCTVAGTPGTWASASGGGVTSLTGTSNQVVASASTGAVTLSTPQDIATTSNITFKSIAAGGLTGATAASRYVGATASGAPASGTFAVGDLIVDQTGKLWVCTGAGSPGTWVQIGGSSGAITQLADSTLSGTAASFDLTSISGSYNHLKIVFQLRGDRATAANVANVRLNNDSGSNYDYTVSSSNNGTSLDGATGSAQTSLSLLYANYASDAANYTTGGEITIPNYTGTTFYKNVTSLFSCGPAAVFAGNGAGVWKSTAAVTRVTILPLSGNWIIGSRVTLYGLT